MVSSGPPSLGFPPSFPCRCRFLRMSQLACSFLLICVECLTRWAQIITMTMIKIMNMTMTVIKIMIMIMIMIMITIMIVVSLMS